MEKEFGGDSTVSALLTDEARMRIAIASLEGEKLVSHFPENPIRFGKPTVQATVSFCRFLNGELLGMIEPSFMTAVRTEATGGLVAEFLARPAAEMLES